MDESLKRSHQRGAVLDLSRRKSWCRAVHGDEHDERFAALERLRSGCVRGACHACVATRVGNAKRFARLEQQLRKRSEQGRVFPLRQLAQTFLQRSKDGFSRDQSRAR